MLNPSVLVGRSSIVDKAYAYGAKEPGFTTRWRQQFINVCSVHLIKMELRLGPTYKKKKHHFWKKKFLEQSFSTFWTYKLNQQFLMFSLTNPCIKLTLISMNFLNENLLKQVLFYMYFWMTMLSFFNERRKNTLMQSIFYIIFFVQKETQRRILWRNRVVLSIYSVKRFN